MDRWRVHPGDEIDLRAFDTSSTDGSPGDDDIKQATKDLRHKLADLQGRLWAEHQRSLLVVLQALDAGGKDGTIKHVFKGVNPQGCEVTSFKQPSAEETDHDFLWRIHKAVPARGRIGIFNRSHYEDVLIVRVHELVPDKVWRARYDDIRAFEENLTEAGTTVVKLFLHISKDEQARRFQRRLDQPDKCWKFSKADLEERKHWDDYMDAFHDAIVETTTETAPWYVIPGDDKTYRNWVVSSLLVDILEKMDPQYPPPEPGLDKIKIK